MTAILSAVVVLTGVLASDIWRVQAATQLRAPDVTIRTPGQPLVLRLPASGAATFELLQRLLEETGVRYGLEEAPSEKDSAPIDLGRPADREVFLNGLKLGEALDRIVTAYPHYGWEESEGRIIVRALDSRSPLQLRLSSIVLDRAPLTSTVEALMRALDSDRPAGGILRSGVQSTVIRADGTAQTDGGREPAITISLDRPTLLEALNAIASNHPSVSWIVRQDGTGDADGVGLTLSVPHAGVTALSDRMVRSARSGASKMSVPLTLGIRSALAAYAKRARVLIGLEMVPASQNERPPGAGLLDLTGVPPTEGVTRIVRMDSRYAWVEAAGLFDVRPAVHVRDRSPLDRPIDGLNASNETIDGIVDRIMGMLGSKGDSGRGEGWGSMPGSPDRLKAEAARRRPLTLQVGPTTVRELLNSLCRAEGTLSWTLTPILRNDGLVLVSLQVDSWDDWGTSRSFTLSKW
jgi:hypothetical protein